MQNLTEDRDLAIRTEVELVTRTLVEAGKPYSEYRQDLRYDFFHSCAYCTMSEAEASGVRFTIDHYEPRSAYPELADQYNNLMYCCDECNSRKGPRHPSDSARAAGLRFFRPDQDIYTQSFERAGLLLKGLSEIAEFTIDAVDLNRLNLRRLRDIRARLSNCERMVTAGIRALRGVKIDALPPSVRSTAQKAIAQLEETHIASVNAIEEVLRRHAASSYLDEDPYKEAHNRLRLHRLKGTEAAYPGEWRHKNPTPKG